MVLKKRSLYEFCAVLSFLLLLTGCSNSNVKTDSKVASTNQKTKNIDPYQNFNRKVYAFNIGVDKLLLKPVAKAYKVIAPKAVDDSIGNVFANLGDVGNTINNVLQGKFSHAANDAGRFLVNSTIGLAGLIDIASPSGFDKHDEDFGQTLAKWGMKSGPYVMLPLLGPSTIRDASAKLTVDRFTDPAHYHNESIALTGLKVIKKRTDFFAEEEILKDLSNDQYSALRDIWLQNRKFLIRDGKTDKSAASDLINELESLESE